MKDSLFSLSLVFHYLRLQWEGDSLTVLYKCNAYFPAKPLVELFGGEEKGIKQLITLMYCFRGDLPNLANIVGTQNLFGFFFQLKSIGRYLCIGFNPRSDHKIETK